MAPVSVFPVFLMLLGLLGAGIPLGVPPVDDPMMSHVAPEECLYYASWAGTGEPDPKSPNRTEQLLAEPEVQHLIQEVQRQIRRGVRQMAEREGPQASLLAEDAMVWVKTLLTRPTAFFISDVKIGPQGPDIRGGLVVNLGEETAKIRQSLEKHQRQLPPNTVEEVQIDGAVWYRIHPSPEAPVFVWGTKGRYLIVGAGEGSVEAILKRAQGGAMPSWLAELSKQLPVERRCSVGYVNVKAIAAPALENTPPEARRAIDALGLGNIASIAGVSGLDGSGFVSKTLIRLDGEPKGLLTALSGKPLAAADLVPVPRDATFALALRLDADKLLQTIQQVVSEIDPRAGRDMAEAMNEMRKTTGLDPREDVLQPLGDAWCLYSAPSEGGFLFTGATAVVPLRDAPRAKKSFERIMERQRQVEKLNASLGYHDEHVLDFECAGHKVFYIRVRDEGFPFAPAWCMTDKELIVALFPQNIKAHLTRGENFVSLAENKTVNALLQGPDGPLALAYVDSPELFKLVYPGLQVGAKYLSAALGEQRIEFDLGVLPSAPSIARHLAPTVTAVRRTAAGIEIVSHQTMPGGNIVATAPVTAALLIPAVRAARTSAQRMASMMNLKQIALAMHLHHDIRLRLPPAYSVDKQGKPLLSWRVHILPYIEQDTLYRAFHLDEPWDSEHNKKLIADMPLVYRAPASTAGPGMTDYVTVRGPQTMFPGEKPMGFIDVTDGLSNTIMVVESARPVIWTKPDDFEPSEENPMAGLLGLYPGGFNAAFGDASVQFISAGADPKTLWLAYQRDDGMPINMQNLFDEPGVSRKKTMRPTSKQSRDDGVMKQANRDGPPLAPKTPDKKAAPAPRPRVEEKETPSK